MPCSPVIRAPSTKRSGPTPMRNRPGADRGWGAGAEATGAATAGRAAAVGRGATAVGRGATAGRDSSTGRGSSAGGFSAAAGAAEGPPAAGPASRGRVWRGPSSRGSSTGRPWRSWTRRTRPSAGRAATGRTGPPATGGGGGAGSASEEGAARGGLWGESQGRRWSEGSVTTAAQPRHGGGQHERQHRRAPGGRAAPRLLGVGVDDSSAIRGRARVRASTAPGDGHRQRRGGHGVTRLGAVAVGRVARPVQGDGATAGGGRHREVEVDLSGGEALGGGVRGPRCQSSAGPSPTRAPTRPPWSWPRGWCRPPRPRRP